MGQRFCQISQLFPQFIRLQQLRLVPEGQHPAEDAAGVGKAAGKAQPAVRLHGEPVGSGKSFAQIDLQALACLKSASDGGLLKGCLKKRRPQRVEKSFRHAGRIFKL